MIRQEFRISLVTGIYSIIPKPKALYNEADLSLRNYRTLGKATWNRELKDQPANQQSGAAGSAIIPSQYLA